MKVLMAAGADVNAMSSDGETALIAVAISDGEADIEEMHPVYVDIAGMLLEAGAKADARDSGGQTALDQAHSYGLDELVKVLEEAGS